MFAGLGSDGERAKFAKETFSDYVLEHWKIDSIESEQASKADIKVTATINAEARRIRIRMILWTSEGKLGMSLDTGEGVRGAIGDAAHLTVVASDPSVGCA